MKKILIIEDEQVLQKTLEKFLIDEGYNLVSATDGEIGLKLARTQKPNLIMLDLILPKLNGFEVLKELKANKETKNIPVIILTNLETMDDINKALELGATTYLVKVNYKLEEIVEKIEQTIQ